MRTTAHRAVRAAAALAVAAVSLTGCSTLNDVISPADARAQAPEDAEVTGPVDCRVAKCVALTFDGGPSEPTPKLLDLLERENVHATFFLQGKGHVDTFPDTVRRMAREGHEIANHTLTHKNLKELTDDEVRAELLPVQRDIARLTGHAPELMRPPGGATDDDLKKTMKDLGLAQILWSVTAKDYATTDTALIEKRVLDGAKRDGIILLHERYAGTIPAVPDIIRKLRDQEYTFVTVSQLMAPAKPQPGEVYRP
ncbi:polysaccharide deacetylase family protein [Streptomyces althioticus]|uniref:polysaccharide deacetylase family protein n=1 Tax=Actinomycetes TaxID=1760 RepID=UPI0005269E98|nr:MULTISPECIES: polysaccharide deacetylase family protein [Actinomycetes]MBM4832672.1 polysaccharide deacetylase family protein [Actinospica acidiphila]GGQ41557.1 deacetylase [Streptomyces althioticus]GGT35332.1 deacetylase [Streptomyces matensis]